MTDVPLITGPLPLASLNDTINALILEVNALCGGDLSELSGPQDPTSYQRTLNQLISLVNSGLGDSIPLLGLLDPGNFESTMNALIGQISAACASAYTTGAVHFDGSTWLDIASLTATDSSDILVSYWIKEVADQSSSKLWMADPTNFQFLTDFPSAIFRPNIYLSDDQSSANGRLQFGTSSDLGFDVWHHVLYSADVNHASGERPHKLYIDDVDVTADVLDTGIAFVLSANGVEFAIGSDTMGSNFTGDFADFWWGLNQYLDLSITANRRKFISAAGRPVDLGSDGSAPTGTAPTFFLRRAPSAAASTFADDKSGHGNTFTITGTPPTSGALSDASSSPSD